VAKSEPELLTVNASSPFRIFYVGPAIAVSGVNKVGPFDVLPGHSSFFSVLEQGDVTIDTGKPDADLVSFKVSNGLISVRNNNVELFVNI
jgi:F0F1-type ATP synthase epsilon subunit